MKYDLKNSPGSHLRSVEDMQEQTRARPHLFYCALSRMALT